MESGVVAAGAAALAYYVYLRTKRELPTSSSLNHETHRTVEHAPSNWTGELFLFAEAIRYLYVEYITHWPTADLFIGVTYLARQGIKDFPAAEVVAHGTRINPRELSRSQASLLKDKFDTMYRLLVYSQKLRNTSLEIPEGEWEDLQIGIQDFVIYNPKASVLRPAYVIVRDPVLNAFVLAIRGTHTTRDIFTSLTGAAKPHHTVSNSDVVLGYSHCGMLAGARWIFKHCQKKLIDAHVENPDFKLLITGHSMGGGGAAMLTMMIREQMPMFTDAQCYAFACPGCMTLELAQSCSSYVTTLVYGTDVVPTVSPGAGDVLRDEVAQSSWAKSFKQDIRASPFVQTIEGRARGLYRSASSWTLKQATNFSSMTTRCVRPQDKSEAEIPLQPQADNVQEEHPLAPPQEITATSSEITPVPEDTVENKKENIKQTTVNSKGHSFFSDIWGRVSNISWKRKVSDGEIPEDLVDQSDDSGGDVEGVFNTNGIDNETINEKIDNQGADEDEANTSNGNNPNFKRLLYPAGTIYHLVPAYILKADKSNQPEINNIEDEAIPAPAPSSSSSPLLLDSGLIETRQLHDSANYDKEEDEFVLFSNMPQEAYGKIRVCRSMVMDHFVPRYKTAVQAAIQSLSTVLEKESIHNI